MAPTPHTAPIGDRRQRALRNLRRAALIGVMGLLLLWGLPAIAGGGGTPGPTPPTRPDRPAVTTGGETSGALGPGIAIDQIPLPTLEIGAQPADSPQDVSTGIQLLILLTILSLAPSILIMMTGFTRIVIVLGMVRNALGTQNLPPNQVIVGLALMLTFFVMAPVLNQINTEAVQPFLNEEIGFPEALATAQGPVRAFMFDNTRPRDLQTMLGLAELDAPETRAEVPTWVLLPAFVLSELKTAFQMGFVVFIPFLIIDLVVSSTLMSMGMIFLPPVLISLPFKILLFVMTDGWILIAQSLVTSFR